MRRFRRSDGNGVWCHSRKRRLRLDYELQLKVGIFSLISIPRDYFGDGMPTRIRCGSVSMFPEISSAPAEMIPSEGSSIAISHSVNPGATERASHPLTKTRRISPLSAEVPRTRRWPFLGEATNVTTVIGEESSRTWCVSSAAGAGTAPAR